MTEPNDDDDAVTDACTSTTDIIPVMHENETSLGQHVSVESNIIEESDIPRHCDEEDEDEIEEGVEETDGNDSDASTGEATTMQRMRYRRISTCFLC